MIIRMLSFSWIVSTIFLIYSCSSNSSQDPNPQATIKQISEVLFEQQKAWNQGDIDAFMEGYWKSDDLSFCGKNGLTKGWDNTLANYKNGYPDLDAMGRLEFEIIDTRLNSSSTAIMIGKFTLYRKEDKPTGYFTLVWEKINDQWLITSDHTSS